MILNFPNFGTREDFVHIVKNPYFAGVNICPEKTKPFPSFGKLFPTQNEPVNLNGKFGQQLLVFL